MLYPAALGGRTGVYMNNRLYDDSGQVLDVTDPLNPILIGQSPGGALALRDAQHVMWAATGGDITASQRPSFLGFFDPLTLQSIATASFAIPAPAGEAFGDIESVGALVYAGDDAAALTVTDSNGPNRVAIVHSTMIRTPPAAPSSDGGLPDAGADGGLLSVVAADGGSPPDPCAGCTFMVVPAYGGGVVYDASRNLIYVTADSAAMANKNSLVTVDPVHGTVVSALPVGKDPGPLALSDDASTLWLGNSGDATVQQLALGPPQVAGPSYVLPAAMPYSTTPSIATSLVVLSGAGSSIAASISGPEVIVLDDGVPRPTVVNGSSATGGLIRGPGSTLFGWNTFETFGVLGVAAPGISQMSFTALLAGTNLRSIVYLNGAVYGNDGTVIDVSVPSAPVPGGRIQYTASAIAVRDATHLLLLSDQGLSDDHAVYTSTPVLQVIDTTTLTVVGSAFFPRSAPARSAASRSSSPWCTSAVTPSRSWSFRTTTASSTSCTRT